MDRTSWCQLYTSGLNIYEIAKLSDVSAPTVSKYLKSHNIIMRSYAECKAMKTPYDMILRDYDNGMSLSKLSKTYSMSITGLSNIMKRNGRIIRLKTSPVDWTFIDHNKELFLYWLGWMLSDGCIHYTRRGNRNRGIMTYLGVQTKDRNIVDFFGNVIGIAAKQRTNNLVRLEASIPRAIANYLAGWGLVPAKSKILSPTANLDSLDKDELLQMIVGYIEGDGYSRVRKIRSKNNIYSMPIIGITTGSHTWIMWIREKLNYLGFSPRKIAEKIGGYDYRICGSEAKKLVNLVLSNTKYHLLRRKWYYSDI